MEKYEGRQTETLTSTCLLPQTCQTQTPWRNSRRHFECMPTPLKIKLLRTLMQLCLRSDIIPSSSLGGKLHVFFLCKSHYEINKLNRIHNWEPKFWSCAIKMFLSRFRVSPLNTFKCKVKKDIFPSSVFSLFSNHSWSISCNSAFWMIHTLSGRIFCQVVLNCFLVKLHVELDIPDET